MTYMVSVLGHRGEGVLDEGRIVETSANHGFLVQDRCCGLSSIEW